MRNNRRRQSGGRLWNCAENAHRADLTVLQQAEHAEEWERLVRERAKDGQLAHPGGRQPGDKGISKSAKELGLSREEVRRARLIAAISPEGKAKAVELRLDRKQSALLEIAQQSTEAAQIAKATEIAGRLRQRRQTCKEPVSEKRADVSSGEKIAEELSQDPERPTGSPTTGATSPQGSLVRLEKAPSRHQSQTMFKTAVLNLMKLVTKASADFAGVIPPGDLELLANFLKQVADASKKAP